jgi:hypothetical protein
MILPGFGAVVMHARRRVVIFPSLISANMPMMAALIAQEVSSDGIILLTFMA